MPVLTISKTYADGQTLSQSNLDSAFDSVSSFLNTTKIDSSNIQNGGIATANIASAAITSTQMATNAVTTTAITDAAVTKAKLDATAQTYLVPTGTVLDFAGSSAPTGFLLCDGTAVLRSTYAALFALIGTTYGAGNGTTTFNVPDCRGRTTIGVGAGSGLTSRALAATGGEETHTLSESEMPSHTHTLTGTVYAETGVIAVNTGSSVFSTQVVSGSPPAVSINADGGGATHNNMQPFMALNKIIRT
jgi:microcystin-dependent protein